MKCIVSTSPGELSPLLAPPTVGLALVGSVINTVCSSISRDGTKSLRARSGLHYLISIAAAAPLVVCSTRRLWEVERLLGDCSNGQSSASVLGEREDPTEKLPGIHVWPTCGPHVFTCGPHVVVVPQLFQFHKFTHMCGNIFT